MKFSCLIANVARTPLDNEGTNRDVMWRAKSRESSRHRGLFHEYMRWSISAHYNGDHALSISHMRRVLLEVENVIQHWDCHTFVGWLEILSDLCLHGAVNMMRLLQTHAKDWSQATLPTSDLRRHLLTTLVEIDVSQLQQVVEDAELLLLNEVQQILGDGSCTRRRIWLAKQKLETHRMLAVDDYLPTQEAAATQFGTQSSAYTAVLSARCNVYYDRECYANSERTAKHMLDSALASRDQEKLIWRASRAYYKLSRASFSHGPHRFSEARGAAIEAISLKDQYCHEYPESIPPIYPTEVISLMGRLKIIAEYDGKDEEAAQWAQKILELRKPPDDFVV